MECFPIPVGFRGKNGDVKDMGEWHKPFFNLTSFEWPPNWTVCLNGIKILVVQQCVQRTDKQESKLSSHLENTGRALWKTLCGKAFLLSLAFLICKLLESIDMWKLKISVPLWQFHTKLKKRHIYVQVIFLGFKVTLRIHQSTI